MPERQLSGLSHFHQPPGRHPRSREIGADEELIELLTGGRGWVEIDGSWQEVLPGDLLWHCAGDSSIGRSDFADPYRCLAMRYTVDPAASAERPAPRLTRWDDLAAVRALTERVLQDYVDERFPTAVVGDYAYAVLRYRAQAWLRRQRTGALPAPLQRVLRHLEEDYASEVGTAELARLAGWSEAHLHAEFRRHLQTTPHQYLIQRRLRAARSLLTTTRDPIAEIGLCCGFGDAAHFSRAFRSAVGCSPRQYRLRHEHPEHE